MKKGNIDFTHKTGLKEYMNKILIHQFVYKCWQNKNENI